MKNVVFAAGFVASLLFSSNASAIPIYGSVDTLLLPGYDQKDDCGALTLPSCEERKLEDRLGGDAGSLAKIETPGGAGWSYVSGSTTLATFDLSKFGFQTAIEYFVVKIGNAVDDFYVFKNEASTQYALIDLSAITASSGRITLTSLSHISTVPEPGTLILTGLLGMGLASARRRFHSARNA